MEPSQHEEQWKMNFEDIKARVMNFLDANGWADLYIVGPNEQKGDEYSTPPHLCVTFEFRSDVESKTKSIRLIQPSVSWLRIGPMDNPGKIITPYLSENFNYRNIDTVFHKVLSDFVKRESYEFKHNAELSMARRKAMIASVYQNTDAINQLVEYIRSCAYQVGSQFNNKRFPMNEEEIDKDLMRALFDNISRSPIWK